MIGQQNAQYQQSTNWKTVAQKQIHRKQKIQLTNTVQHYLKLTNKVHSET